MYLFVMSIRCQKMLVRDVYETEVTLYGRHSDRTYVNDVPSLPFDFSFEVCWYLTLTSRNYLLVDGHGLADSKRPSCHPR